MKKIFTSGVLSVTFGAALLLILVLGDRTSFYYEHMDSVIFSENVFWLLVFLAVGFSIKGIASGPGNNRLLGAVGSLIFIIAVIYFLKHISLPIG